jgi:hypothetical protein
VDFSLCNYCIGKDFEQPSAVNPGPNRLADFLGAQHQGFTLRFEMV